MTRAYCTLFDVNYLTRGITLYRSLEQQSSKDFRLWAFCMDEPTETVLRRLELPSLEVVPLTSLEAHDPTLRGTKDDRTQVEYCWTATPAVCRYVLETEPSAESVTYLDADLMFFDDPRLLFDEIADNAVAITPHRYAPPYQAKEETSGTYNVSWVTFTRDEDGLAALAWWHERCIEWCYARYEDGKLGDQKYLESFPTLFRRVHALEQPGAGLAPWNVSAHELSGDDGAVRVDGRPLVFYHFHSLREYGATPASRAAAGLGRLRVGVPPAVPYWDSNYPVSDLERALVWMPYLTALGTAAQEVDATAPGLRPRPPGYPLSLLSRRVAGGAYRRARSIDVARFVPGAMYRYRNSWKSQSVAEQMADLVDTELTRFERDAASVPPYRAFLDLLPALLEDEGLPRPATFLDIGCGVGAYSELLSRHAPGRFDYVGADYADELLEAARLRWPDRRFEQRDLYEPGALDGFDVIFASGVIEVMPEPERALDVFFGSVARWAILHRQQIDERGSRVTIVPGIAGSEPTARSSHRGDLTRSRTDTDAVSSQRRWLPMTSTHTHFSATVADSLLDPQGVRRLGLHHPAERVTKLARVGRCRGGSRRQRGGHRGSSCRTRSQASARRRDERLRNATLGLRLRCGRASRVQPLRCFVNADIILLDDFAPALARVSQSDILRLMIGETVDLPVNDELALDQPEVRDLIARRAHAEGRSRGRLQSTTSSSRRASSIRCRHSRSVEPASTTGSSGAVAQRGASDRRAARRSWPFISTTTTPMSGGHDEAHHGPEAERNRSLAGGSRHLYTIHDASHRLDRGSARAAQHRRLLRAARPLGRPLWRIRHRV